MADPTADTEELRWMPKQDNNLDDRNGKLWDQADHFPLRYQCGICNVRFEEGNELVGLVEGNETTRLGYITGKFLWEKHGQPKVEGRKLCSLGECRKCRRSRASASVHIDCLRGFIQSKKYDDKLHRLWRFAQARRPHPTMPSVLLPDPGPTHIELKVTKSLASDTSDTSDTSDRKFFGHVADFSQEILLLIRDQSPSSTPWQISAGQALSDSLFAIPQDKEFGSLPLNKIASWEQGQGIDDVVRRNDGSQGSGHVRLVMDAYGIQKVETVPYEQGHNINQRRDDVVFITVTGNNFGKCRATIADGRMTLHHPPGEYGPTKFWITDFPVGDVSQDDHRREFLGRERRKYSTIPEGLPSGTIPRIFNRYRSVNLGAVTGLTFFYGFVSDGKPDPIAELVDIYSHTVGAPDATMFPDSRHLDRRTPFRWVYVPIARGDEIKELAILMLHSRDTPIARPIILIRTKLSGDIWVGWSNLDVFPSPQMEILEENHHNVRVTKDPTTLFYLKPELGSVGSLGTEKQWRGTPGPRPFANLTFKRYGTFGDVSKHRETLFSDAPLEGVVRADVYMYALADPPPGRIYYCTGILFTYANKSQRAVGECRVGDERCVIHSYENPVGIQVEYFNVRAEDWHPKSPSGDKLRTPSEHNGVDCVWVDFRELDGNQEVNLNDTTVARQRQMTGRLAFWMTEYDTYAGILD